MIEYLQYRGSSVSTYLSSGWNFLQVLTYSCVILSSIQILMLFERNVAFYRIFIFAGWTSIIVGSNFLSFLRPFPLFGPIIRMLIQIVQDIMPFFCIQIVIYFSFYVGIMNMWVDY